MGEGKEEGGKECGSVYSLVHLPHQPLTFPSLLSHHLLPSITRHLLSLIPHLLHLRPRSSDPILQWCISWSTTSIYALHVLHTLHALHSLHALHALHSLLAIHALHILSSQSSFFFCGYLAASSQLLIHFATVTTC